MRRVDMVRCTLVEAATGESEVRYIPFSVYELWKYLIEQQGPYNLSNIVISTWVDHEGYAFEKGQLESHEVEPVVEICMDARFEETGDPVPTMRYYSVEEFDRTRAFLGKAGLDRLILQRCSVTPGLFVLKEEPPVP